MTATYLQRVRQFNRNVRLVLIACAATGFCYSGIIAVLVNLYLLRLGYGPKFIGLFNGIAFLAYAAACIPAGALGRRWGSRRSMVAGMSISVVGYGLLMLVELMPIALREGWLLFSYPLAFLGAGVWMVNATPFLAGATTEERDHAFSVQAAMFPLGAFAGGLVAGLLPGLLAKALGLSLDDPAPYRVPLVMASVTYAIVALPALFATREVDVRPAEEAARGAGVAPYGLIAVMSVTMLLRVSGEWTAGVFFNVYLDASLRASTSLIGTLLAVSNVLVVPAALAAPLLMERLGKDGTTIWGAFGVALGLLPLALIPHWGAAGLGLAGVLVAATIALTAGTVYGQEVVSPGWRAPMSGALMTAWGLSPSIMSFGGGYIIEALGYRSLFLVASVLTASGALLFWAYFRVPRGELARAVAAEGAE